MESIAHEINPHKRIRASLNSSLQRDLGFDSLGLSELVLRTEKEFKLRLPDDLLSRLETPADLAAEIRDLGFDLGVTFTRETEKLPGDTVEALPQSAETLIDVLKWHASQHPERPHILLSDGYHESETISFQGLTTIAARQANGMLA